MNVRFVPSALARVVRLWINSSLDEEGRLCSSAQQRGKEIDWLRVIPFVILHLIALYALFFTVASLWLVVIAVISYLVRMFAITAFYHRYFSHKTFHVSRWVQCIFAFVGGTASQRGALWWASHHRSHHIHADKSGDPHAAGEGFMWSHMGWFLSRQNYKTDYSRIKDLAKYPELVWLNKHELVPPLVYLLALYVLGLVLHEINPEQVSSALSVPLWGYFVSTMFLTHVTLCINSMAHCWGTRRYKTSDTSRNNLFLALVTLGEGWHNNHHHYPGSVKQGFYWWEVDISYYLLRLFSLLGLVSNLKPVPAHVLTKQRVND